jgi:hypothetical protein
VKILGAFFVWDCFAIPDKKPGYSGVPPRLRRGRFAPLLSLAQSGNSKTNLAAANASAGVKSGGSNLRRAGFVFYCCRLKFTESPCHPGKLKSYRKSHTGNAAGPVKIRERPF